MEAQGPDPVLDDVAACVAIGHQIVLVHGGGPQIDAALQERGIGGARVAGLRVTDAATLAVTENVLCGSVNKALVRALLMRGVPAAGISGQDGALISATPEGPVEGVQLGFVGRIVRVRPAILEAIVGAGFVPVVAPLGVYEDGSTALNLNADTVAGAIAGALKADAYIVVTNVERVRSVAEDPSTGLASLTRAKARAYLDGRQFAGGMRPKIESALDALERGARSAIIIGSSSGVLGRALAGEGTKLLST